MTQYESMYYLSSCPVSSFEKAQAAVEELIGLDILIEAAPERERLYREIVRIIADAFMRSPERPVIIDGEEIRFGYLQEIYRELEPENISDVADALERYPREIRYKKAFLRTALFNARLEAETGVTNLFAVNNWKAEQ